MAKQMIKPYSFLLYFLAFVASFFGGVSYAGWIEAAKDQMLAAGAIVLGYGVMGAIIGLFAALIIAYGAGRTVIIRLNMILPLIIIAFVAYYAIKFKRKQKAKQEQDRIEQQKKPIPTKPVNWYIDHVISFAIQTSVKDMAIPASLSDYE